MSVLEYLSMTLLIVVAFSIYQAKSRYFLAQPRSYRNLMIGLTAFLGVFLVQALGAAGTFQAWAGTSGPIVGSLLQAALLLVGGGFVGVALVQWLPRLADAQVQVQRLQDKFSLLEAIAVAKGRLIEPEEMAVEIARLLRLVLRDIEIEVYTYTRKTETLSPQARPEIEVGRYTGVYHFCAEVLTDATSWLARSGIDSDNRASAVLPIGADAERTYLLLCNWPQGKAPDSSEEQLLRLIRSGFEVAVVEDSTPDLQGAFAQLRSEMAGAERLADELLPLDATLREIVGHDLLRVAVFDDRGLNVTQYALGSGQNVLTERDKSISTNETRLGSIFVEPQVVACDDLSTSQFTDDRWLAQCGVQRAVSLPLVGPDRVLAVVTLASTESDLAVCRDQTFQRELTETLLPVVQADLLTQQSIAFNRRVLDLTATLKDVVERGGGEQVLTSVTETIVRQFPATAAQVWRYDAAGDTFSLTAASYAHAVAPDFERNVSVQAAAARWRRQALQTRKLTVYNQAIADSDATPPQVLPDIKSALFVPLTSGETELGVLVIAEMRNPERRRFSLSETLFARGMASVATLALLTKANAVSGLERLVSNDRLVENSPSLEHMFRLPQRLATPLTSILARSQQLLSSELGKDEPNKRSLQIIGEQAELIIREMRDVQQARQEQIFS